MTSILDMNFTPWRASSGTFEAVLQQIPFDKLVLRKKEGLDRSSHDACTCGRHDRPRRSRCAHEEAVDLDLGILNFMVEHLHATRQDICSQDTSITASMGFPDTERRRDLGAGSCFDAIFTCVIYTLGRSLVAAKNLQLDLNELLRRRDANIRSSLLDARRLRTICWWHCAARLTD